MTDVTSELPAQPEAPAETATTELVPSPEAPPTAETTAPPRRKRGLLIAAIVGGALLLVGGGLGITYAVLAAQHAPEQQLDTFLQSLVDGDAPAARKLLLGATADVPDLLTDDIYAAASDRIEKFEVTKTVIDGSTATVTASITQAGETSTQEFVLKTAGRDLVFDVWRVDTDNLPRVTVKFERPDGTLVVNGVSAEEYSATMVPGLLVFPGRYEFTATDLPEYLQVEGAEVLTVFAGQKVNSGATLKTTLSDAGTAAARAAVETHIAWCLSQPVLHPDPTCGYYVIPNEATYTNIRWTMTVAPVYEFGEWIDGASDLVVTALGSIREDSDFTTSSQYGTAEAVFDDYEPYGFVTFDADGVAVFESQYVE